MADVSSKFAAKTKVTLRKFEGDGPEDRTDEPIETITVEDGKITEVIKRGEK